MTNIISNPEPWHDPRRLDLNYPGAYTDFKGTPSGAATIFKTGEPHPLPSGLEAYYRRELIPVTNHPIQPLWTTFLIAVLQYLTSINFPITCIAGVGVKDVRASFLCPLVIVIGCNPGSVTFELAKATVTHIKEVILGGMGFGTLDVALREWLVEESATRANQSAVPRHVLLRPLLCEDMDAFRPFTSLLGLSISTTDNPSVEGTGGVYFRRRNSKGSFDYLLVTARHVVRPPSTPGFANTMITSDGEEKILAVSLGETSYANAITLIDRRLKTLHETVEASRRDHIQSQQAAKDFEQDHDSPEEYADLCDIAALDEQGLREAQRRLEKLTKFKEAVKSTDSTPPTSRVIGSVAHSDPIAPGESIDGGPGYWVDLAAAQLNDDFV